MLQSRELFIGPPTRASGDQMIKKLTPLKAIRKHCIECCGGSPKEVRLCTDKTCFLWSFRFGMTLERYLNRKRYVEKKKMDFCILKQDTYQV